ncbi:MAG: hypothetical protein H6810_07615 [Phycisphaeraceae bacterium]|nr:MAG: hypothetical protein H6810_07615 [Phycisphaeraceae bacterium]
MDHRSLITSAPHRLDCPFASGKPYTLLMVCLDPDVGHDDKRRIAREIGETGCVNYCVWGHDAPAWELAVDGYCVGMGLRGIERHINTTEHSSEPVDDAVFFATTVMAADETTSGRVLIWILAREVPDESDHDLVRRVFDLKV